MSVKSILFLAIRSALFGALIVVSEYGLREISWGLEQTGHESLADLMGLLDYFVTMPGHPFAFQSVAINVAIFVFWAGVYFVVGVAHRMARRRAEKP